MVIVNMNFMQVLPKSKIWVEKLNGSSTWRLPIQAERLRTASPWYSQWEGAHLSTSIIECSKWKPYLEMKKVSETGCTTDTPKKTTCWNVFIKVAVLVTTSLKLLSLIWPERFSLCCFSPPGRCALVRTCIILCYRYWVYNGFHFSFFCISYMLFSTLSLIFGRPNNLKINVAEMIFSLCVTVIDCMVSCYAVIVESKCFARILHSRHSINYIEFLRSSKAFKLSFVLHVLKWFITRNHRSDQRYTN